MNTFVNFYQSTAKRRQKYRYAKKHGISTNQAHKMRDLSRATSPVLFFVRQYLH
jgi:hypothetical protein